MAILGLFNHKRTSVKVVPSFLLRHFVLCSSPRANLCPGRSCTPPTQPELSFRSCGHRKSSSATNRFSPGFLADSLWPWAIPLAFHIAGSRLCNSQGPAPASSTTRRPWGERAKGIWRSGRWLCKTWPRVLGTQPTMAVL